MPTDYDCWFTGHEDERCSIVDRLETNYYKGKAAIKAALTQLDNLVHARVMMVALMVRS